MAALPSDWRPPVDPTPNPVVFGTTLPPKPTAPLTTPTDPASAAATEAMWKLLQDAPMPALAEVMAWLAWHPEILKWATAGRFNPTPGATP